MHTQYLNLRVLNPVCLQAEGLHEDPTILFVSEVELVEMRSVEDEPLVVAQFNCQQIKCTRDP